jgi:hypothetical protein
VEEAGKRYVRWQRAGAIVESIADHAFSFCHLGILSDG